MIDESELKEILITGRLECYVKTSPTSNPYQPGKMYDWEFELYMGEYLFKDSYRGTNPYSGVEYVLVEDVANPRDVIRHVAVSAIHGRRILEEIIVH